MGTGRWEGKGGKGTDPTFSKTNAHCLVDRMYSSTAGGWYCSPFSSSPVLISANANPPFVR